MCAASRGCKSAGSVGADVRIFQRGHNPSRQHIVQASLRFLPTETLAVFLFFYLKSKPFTGIGGSASGRVGSGARASVSAVRLHRPIASFLGDVRSALDHSENARALI